MEEYADCFFCLHDEQLLASQGGLCSMELRTGGIIIILCNLRMTFMTRSKAD